MGLVGARTYQLVIADAAVCFVKQLLNTLNVGRRCADRKDRSTACSIAGRKACANGVSFNNSIMIPGSVDIPRFLLGPVRERITCRTYTLGTSMTTLVRSLSEPPGGQHWRYTGNRRAAGRWAGLQVRATKATDAK